jgi:cyclopropane fatty-acyl-phospholipid synthase-like methyltransferase
MDFPSLNYIYQVCYRNYRAATIDTRISAKETMYDQWYFDMGKDAVSHIALGCLSARVTSVKRVLDFPCGHGRVLRHLVHFFPGAEFHACDLDVDGLDFCHKTFGATPVPSVEDLTKVRFPGNYDVIWIGSLFSHTSREITRRWMSHLVQFLSPSGIIVATLHGRWSEQVHKVYPYIAADRWSRILQEYRSTGHGYGDYGKNESHSYIEGSYGISIAKPHVTIMDVEDIPGVRIYVYRERSWGDHQDLLVFGKPAHDEKWPHM